MSETPRLDLPYIAMSQQQKEVTHNLSLDILDTVVQASVKDRDLATPPASPATGDTYIVAAAPTDAWADHATHLAAYISSQWKFSVPLEGWLAYVQDEDLYVSFTGTTWTVFSAGGGGSTFLGLSDTPDTYTGQAGKVVSVNPGATALEFTSPSAGASTFLALTDTPEAYTGTAGQYVKVNAGATALEFGAGTSGTFLALTDTPDAYTGHNGKVVSVKSDATGVEFVVPAGGTLGLHRGALLALGSSQAVPHDTATLLSWGSATYDTNSLWSASQPTRLTVPAGISRIMVMAQVEWDGPTAGMRRLRLLRNGTTVAGQGTTQQPVDGAAIPASPVVLAVTTPPLEVSAGDYFTLEVLQTSGATLNAVVGQQTWLAGMLLSEMSVGAGATLGAEVQRAAAQSIANNSNVALSWDTELRDDAALFDPAQPTRLTAPTAGWYAISTSIQWDATAGATRILNARLNGTQYLAVDQLGNAGIDQRQALSFEWYLAAGDYWEIVVFQSTGAARNLTAVGSLVGLTASPTPSTFLALTDTPDTYSGHASQLVRVNPAGTALDFPATVVVDASGSLGVGTTTPAGRLTVQNGHLLVQRDDAATTQLTLNATSVVTRQIQWQTNGVSRWNVGVSSDAESGNHAGSNFTIARRADDGTALSTILRCERETGNVQQGTFATDPVSRNNWILGSGTAPTLTLTNAIALWARDRGGVADKMALHLRVEDGTQHVLGDLVGLGTLLTATLGSGASYQALSVKGSTLYVGQSSVQERALALVQSAFVVATDATRTGRLTLSAYDATAAREGLRVEADGAAARLSFHGVPAVARQAVPAAGTDAGTVQTLVNSLRSALINYGLCV